MANVTNLSVKIGIGFGKCALLYVGGIFDRSEFFTVGSALTFALESEEQATEGGQIIVSDTAFKHVKNQYYEGAEIISKTNNKFYRVTKVKESVRGRADAILIKQSIKHDKILQVQKSLRSCVPAAIIPYLEIGFERFGSENRALTVMFASLGVDLSSASSEKGMQKIQKIVTTVQQQVYRLEGSLNKLVMDDKGSTLICIWGLCPMAHTDDPQRAILTALNMKKALDKVEKTWCNVGIATGDVFSGVVGTSGSRKEFSVLGDTVNLAARIMFWPKKFGQTGKINCDLRTKQEAMNQISFKYGGHCEFKGKSISIPIYAPIDPEEEYSYFEQKKQHPPQMCLKLSYNPLIVQKEVNHKKFSERMIGQSNFITEIFDEIKSFFLQNSFPNSDEKSSLNIIIQGELGSGKTFCLRSLCEKLQKDQDFNGKLQMCCQTALLGKQNVPTPDSKSQSYVQHQHNSAQSRLPIFATAPNVESRLKFLGAWRPILRGMLEFSKKFYQISALQILKKMIGSEHLDKTALILDIFGFKPLQLSPNIKDVQKYTQFYNLLNPTNEEQCKNLSLSSPVHFLAREQYTNTVTGNVIDMAVQFIAEFLGEEGSDYMTSDQSNSDQISMSLSGQSRIRREAQQKKTTMFAILIFDNASLLEEESWSLILRVYRQCSNACIIMAVGQDHLGNPMMPKLVKPSVNQLQGILDVPYNNQDQNVVTDFSKEATTYDMPLINKKDFETILKELAPVYQYSQIEEMRSMTSIKDPETTIKTVKEGEMWVQRITDKLNLHKVFKTVDDGIVVHIVQKCEGNPLICLQYFYNLINNGFIRINERDQVVPNESFEQCMKLHDFTTIPSPSPVHKRRLKNLDDYLKMGRTQNNQRKQELVIKGIMLMKAASCIGDEFGTQALKKILPLRNESHGSILQILKELESNDFVEILNESDPKNIYCRFNKNFLRESIYQVMLYRDQKQVLHQQLAEHLQSLPTSIMDQKQIEIELLRLKQNILIGEDVKDEKELPFKQMQGLIVKQMQYLLMRNNSRLILHSGWLFKQGQKANKKVSKRLMIMTSKEISWYHDWDEYQNKRQPLGVIQIEHVYQTADTLMSQNTYDFDICTTEYQKKGKLEKGGTLINFGCVTENERHHWISRIEFLRAKIVYENYVKKFVNIQFPLNKEEDVEEDDQQNTEEVYEKLNAFGKNLKSNAKINHSASVNNDNNANKRPTLRKAETILKRRMSIGGNGGITHERQNSLDQPKNDWNDVAKHALKAKEMSLKLKELYRASVISYHSHITQNCNKNKQLMKNKPIGQMPQYFKLSEDVKEKKEPCSHSHDNHHHHHAPQPDHGPNLKMTKTKSDDTQIKHKGAELMKSLEKFQRRSSFQNNKTPDSKMSGSSPHEIHQIEEKSEGSSSSSQSRDGGLKTQKPPFKGAMRRLPTQQRMSEQLSQDRAKQVAKELTRNAKINSRENSVENIRMTSKLDYSSSINKEKEDVIISNKTNSNSENKVSQQLKMIEESNMMNQEQNRQTRGFTFNRNSQDVSKDLVNNFQGQDNSPGIQMNHQFNDRVHMQGFNEVFRRDTQMLLQEPQQYNEPAFAINSHLNSSHTNTNFDSQRTLQGRLNNMSSIRQNDSNRRIFTTNNFSEPPIHTQTQTSNNYTPQTNEPLKFYQHPPQPLAMQQIEPLIQKEVNYQLNMGLKQFFQNLEKKMDYQDRQVQNTEEDIYNRSQDPNQQARMYQGGPTMKNLDKYFSNAGGVSSKNHRFQAASESLPSKQLSENSEDDEPDDGEERDRLFH